MSEICLTPKQAFRFWCRIHRSDSGCWEWMGAVDKYGYGLVGISNRNLMAHRVGYYLQTGNQPADMHVCHRCDNPLCVRIDHIFLGTRHDNMRDMVLKRRASTKLTEENVRQLIALWNTGNYTRVQLADMYGINRRHAGRIINGETWVHLDR